MAEQTETSKKITVEQGKSVIMDTPSSNQHKGNPVSVWKSIFSVWLSRKLWMTVFSTLIIYGTYWHSINHLYSFNKPEQITALSTMYIAMLSVLGVVVATYLGTNAIQSKFGISSAAQLISQSLTEKKEQLIDENIHKVEEVTHNINIDQYIKQEGVNGPEVKPFSALAMERDESFEEAGEEKM